MVRPIYSLKDISYDYHVGDSRFRALHSVSLDIHEGDYCAIIGASGSGKTTLMNLLGLMTPPTEGSMLLDGRDISSLDSDAQAGLRAEKIGFIFQSFHLLSRLSVLDNVMLPARYGAPCHEPVESRARFLLEQLGIGDQADKFPPTLSGGQKQRTAMARALFAQPRVLLADEPTGALDSQTTEQVLALFDELHRMGSTLIVITHNPDVAARARRVIRISDGVIVSDSSSQGLTAPSDHERPHRDTPKSAPTLLSRAKRAWHESCKFALLVTDSLLANRGRSFFTVLGLAVGIIAIVVMMSLTKEARNAFTRFAGTMGGNRAIVMFDMRESERLGIRRWRGLDTMNELPSVAHQFEAQGDIDPIIQAGNCTINSPTDVQQLGISGLLGQHSFQLLDVRVQKGRGFTLSEFRNPELPPVALLGKTAAEKLFPRTDPGYSRRADYPLGEVLFTTGCSFSAAVRVAGILAERDADFGANANETIYIPSLMLTNRGVRPYSTFFQLNPAPGVRPTQFAIAFKNYLSLRTGNKYPFRHFTAERELARVDTMLSIMQGITVLIGGLCTLIGGIGVMNIMLVSITERIKEIGIRKAIGARASHIRNQFLGEAMFFCGLGGTAGIAIGTLISNGIVLIASTFAARYVTFTFTVNWPAVTWALATSLASGLIFGIMPALRASRLDVVDALRSD